MVMFRITEQLLKQGHKLLLIFIIETKPAFIDVNQRADVLNIQKFYILSFMVIFNIKYQDIKAT